MKLFKKLNQKGFSHHFLIPVIVILVIAGIGGYILYKSNAEELAVNKSPELLVQYFHTDSDKQVRRHFATINTNSSLLNSLTDSNGVLLNSQDNRIGYCTCSRSTYLSKVLYVDNYTYAKGALLYDVTSKTYQKLPISGVNAGYSSYTIDQIKYSSDGKKIAYTLVDTNNKDKIRGLYTADVDGSNVVKLSDDDSLNTFSWQPNGNKLLLSFDSGLGNHPIYIINSDKTGYKKIADGDYSTWSHNGKQIAYAVTHTDYPYNVYLHTVNADGTADKRYANTSTFGQAYFTFSPADDWIVFLAQKGMISAVHIRPSTGNIQPITNVASGSQYYQVAWLPDNRIVWTEFASGNINKQYLKSVNFNGTNKTLLSTDIGFNLVDSPR